MRWALALAMASAGTYLLRLLAVHATGGRLSRRGIEVRLHGAAVAILAWLAVSTVPRTAGEAGIALVPALALTAAALSTRWTRNPTLVMLVGVAAYSTAGALLG